MRKQGKPCLQRPEGYSGLSQNATALPERPHFLFAHRLAAIKLGDALADRPLFHLIEGMDAAAARCDFSPRFREFFLVLSRPGGQLAKDTFEFGTHSFSMAPSSFCARPSTILRSLRAEQPAT